MPKKIIEKCPVCQKRANNLDIICKCGKKFCMSHRLPETHSCDFDFKTEQREKLLEQLTESKPPKIIESMR